jgi:cobalt/nickel transport system permease protein
MLLLHIGAFPIDRDCDRPSFWHSLAPQLRVLSILLLVFAINLTPPGQWLTWAIYGLGLIGLALLSHVTLAELGRRVGVEMVFGVVLLLSTLLHSGGTLVWQWGWLQVTTTGLTMLASVTLKLLLCLTALNILVLTTSMPLLLQALLSLRVPPLLVAILAAMVRYLAVLVEEFQRMQRAAASRNLMQHRGWHRLVVGHMVGAVFIRTVERSDRIHQAMVARGLEAIPQMQDGPPLGRGDWVALAVVIGLIGIGQVCGHG